MGTAYQCNCPSNCYGYDCSYCIGTTASTCTDYNPSVCRTYAALGYCNLNAYLNGALFKVSCPVSCNTCSSTTTTIKPTQAPCTDFNPSLCQYYAGLGYCSSTNAYINGAPIRTSCAASCNSCSCVDTQANCVYWANSCSSLPSPNPCPKTCKLC